MTCACRCGPRAVDRETARALDAADFVIVNLTAQVDAYTRVATSMRKRLEALPEAERAEVEEAAAVLRQLRSGDGRTRLPVLIAGRGG